MDSEQVPSQVRIRTDPEDGYDSRYREIQRAKGVFDSGNNTDAVVEACRHARHDKKAKGEALAYLAKRVDPETLAGAVERLNTPTLPVSVETSVGGDRPCVRVSVGGVETHNHVVTSE